MDGTVPTWVEQARGIETWLAATDGYLRAARRWWRQEPAHPRAKAVLLHEQKQRCVLRFRQRHGLWPWETAHAKAEVELAKAEGRPVVRVATDHRGKLVAGLVNGGCPAA